MAGRETEAPKGTNTGKSHSLARAYPALGQDSLKASPARPHVSPHPPTTGESGPTVRVHRKGQGVPTEAELLRSGSAGVPQTCG